MIRSINGKTPRIADSAFVSEAAYVIGDVEIGENSSVWPGVVIRADLYKITIGRSTHIEDCGIIHSGTSIIEIGDRVIVGHAAAVHGRKIGNNTLLGINAIMMPDVEIGEGCLIGAGCLLKQGTRIPDSSIAVGIPGKVTGEVPPKLLQETIDGARDYSILAKQAKEQGL